MCIFISIFNMFFLLLNAWNYIKWHFPHANYCLIIFNSYSILFIYKPYSLGVNGFIWYLSRWFLCNYKYEKNNTIYVHITLKLSLFLLPSNFSLERERHDTHGYRNTGNTFIWVYKTSTVLVYETDNSLGSTCTHTDTHVHIQTHMYTE